MATVGEAVQGGSGEPLAAEYFRPVFEWKVGGDDQTRPFVGRADNVEQKFRTDLAGWNVPQFVEDQQVLFR